jgi:hypothetical protein
LIHQREEQRNGTSREAKGTTPKRKEGELLGAEGSVEGKRYRAEN